MKKFTTFCLLLVFVFLMGGCAKRYYSIHPATIAYTASAKLEEVGLEYRYDVLHQNGNYKIARKEKRYNMKLVAVKITNNTDGVINIGHNAAFYNGSTIIYPMDAFSVKMHLKQSVPSHLFYLLLTPLTFSFNGSNPLPVGLALGPIISGGNMLTAASANKQLYTELLKYDILNRDIQAGETVFGLVCFKNMGFDPLTIKLIE